MIFEETVQAIAEYKEIEASSITAESTFADLGLDSLDTVELAMNLEEKFGVTLEMTEALKTVQDLVNLIKEAKG